MSVLAVILPRLHSRELIRDRRKARKLKMSHSYRPVRWTAAHFVRVGLCLGISAPLILAGAGFSQLANTKITHQNDPPNHLPVFQADAFLRLKANLTGSPTIEALDLQGNMLGSASVLIPDAHVTGVNAFSRGADGTIVAGGWCESADGKIASFIDVIASGGGAPQIIRTNPYGVEKLVVATDGTIWTVGNVLHRASDPPDSDPKGGTVRHFDRSGKLLESFFPYTALDDRLRVMMGTLDASRDRVGWISTGDPQPGKGRMGAYVEFTSAGVQEYPLPAIAPTAGAVLYGLALTDNGGIFVKVLTGGQRTEFMSLDRSTGSWTAVSPFIDPGNDAMLFGASGNTVAVWTPSTMNVYFYQTK
jgi:hypothetical protein